MAIGLLVILKKFCCCCRLASHPASHSATTTTSSGSCILSWLANALSSDNSVNGGESVVSWRRVTWAGAHDRGCCGPPISTLKIRLALLQYLFKLVQFLFYSVNGLSLLSLLFSTLLAHAFTVLFHGTFHAIIVDGLQSFAECVDELIILSNVLINFQVEPCFGIILRLGRTFF